MRTTVKAHSRSVKGKGNRPVRRHSRTRGAEDLRPRKKRGFLQRVMDALTPHSPVILAREKERSAKIQAMREARKPENDTERFHVKNSSQAVVGKHKSKDGIKLKPGEFIFDTHTTAAKKKKYNIK